MKKSGSSYENARELDQQFNSNNLKINTDDVDSIYDANSIFFAVRKILESNKHGVSSKNIVCDCTAGTKFVTLGIALASFGSARLVYFPPTDTNDASEYTEIDTKVFINSLNVDHQPINN